MGAHKANGHIKIILHENEFNIIIHYENVIQDYYTCDHMPSWIGKCKLAPNAGETKKLGHSCVLDGNINGHSHSRKLLGIAYKTQHVIVTQLWIVLSGYYIDK